MASKKKVLTVEDDFDIRWLMICLFERVRLNWLLRKIVNLLNTTFSANACLVRTRVTSWKRLSSPQITLNAPLLSRMLPGIAYAALNLEISV
jgi:hypothetical protein